MKQPRFIIKTTMEKKDYRKFLYFSTFKKNKTSIPLLGLIALLAGIMISWDNGSINFTRLVISWIGLFALAIAFAVIKVEIRVAQRVKTDKTGTFGSISTLKFFDDKIVMENQALKATSQLKYIHFYALVESKDYFIFYINMNQASLVRKQDIENLDEFKAFIAEKFRNRYKSI